MGCLALAWAYLWRKPARTIFTIISLAAAFLLFGLLQGVNATFAAAIGRTQADRLIVLSRFGEPLTHSYLSRIARVPGVAEISPTQTMRGFYQDRKNFVYILAVDANSFFRIRDEYLTAPNTIDALVSKRAGLIVLDKLAGQYGWKVGDTVKVQAGIPKESGGRDWDFDIVGLMTSPSHEGQIPFAVANYSYIDAARAAKDGKGTVSRFVVRVADPNRSGAIGRAIDAEFANSAAPTLAQLENNFAGTQLATIGDVGRLTVAVSSVVFFAILFLAGNVILQSVRERTAEFAVLKTLGFSDVWVLGLVALEASLLCAAGAVLGLAGSAAVFPAVAAYLPNLSAYLSTTSLSPSVLIAGLAIAAALTVLAGALPAWSAKRLNIADALRRRT